MTALLGSLIWPGEHDIPSTSDTLSGARPRLPIWWKSWSAQRMRSRTTPRRTARPLVSCGWRALHTACCCASLQPAGYVVPDLRDIFVIGAGCGARRAAHIRLITARAHSQQHCERGREPHARDQRRTARTCPWKAGAAGSRCMRSRSQFRRTGAIAQQLKSQVAHTRIRPKRTATWHI